MQYGLFLKVTPYFTITWITIRESVFPLKMRWYFGAQHFKRACPQRKSYLSLTFKLDCCSSTNNMRTTSGIIMAKKESEPITRHTAAWKSSWTMRLPRATTTVRRSPMCFSNDWCKGCPFRHYDDGALRMKLHAYKVPSKTINEVQVHTCTQAQTEVRLPNLFETSTIKLHVVATSKQLTT